MQPRALRRFLSLVSVAALSACGGGGDDPAAREDALARPSFSVGGTITGVVSPPFGSSILLSLDGGGYVESFDATTGTFTFIKQLFNRDTYNVIVAGTVPGYTCSVTSGGSGKILRSNVTDIAVSCVLIPRYDVPVSVSGLPLGSSVVIQNNFSSLNQFTATDNGAYKFPYQQYAGTSYYVTVATQPTGASCTVPQPGGVVAAGMSPIAVTCTAN
jgi:hypothetical protein